MSRLSKIEVTNVVRKIRLSKLDCYVVKPEEKELFYFVEQNLLGLKSVEFNEYPNTIMYFNNDDKNIFQHNLKNNDLWVNDDLIWSKFESEFGYNHDKIKEIIKVVVEQAYKLKNVTPQTVHIFYSYQVEQAYKLKNVTPIFQNIMRCLVVEQAYKSKNVTPRPAQQV